MEGSKSPRGGMVQRTEQGERERKEDIESRDSPSNPNDLDSDLYPYLRPSYYDLDLPRIDLRQVHILHTPAQVRTLLPSQDHILLRNPR